MNFLARFTNVLLIFLAGTAWMASPARAQEARVTYLSPAESAQKRGSAPGMKVKLISSGEGSKQCVVILAPGMNLIPGF